MITESCAAFRSDDELLLLVVVVAGGGCGGVVEREEVVLLPLPSFLILSASFWIRPSQVVL